MDQSHLLGDAVQGDHGEDIDLALGQRRAVPVDMGEGEGLDDAGIGQIVVIGDRCQIGDFRERPGRHHHPVGPGIEAAADLAFIEAVEVG